MASIRNLKKEINSVIGGIIEAVFIVEDAKDQPESKEGSAIVDSAIATFDDLMLKINKRDVENRSAHLKEVKAEFEKKARELVDKVNKLSA